MNTSNNTTKGNEMGNEIITGHEAEMQAEAEASAKWNSRPLAARQADVMRGRIASAAEMLESIGKENLFGEVVSAEDAVAHALHSLRAAIRAAEEQAQQTAI